MFKKNHNNSLKHFAIVFWKQNINYMSHLTQHQTTQILNKFKLQTNLNELVLQPDFKKTKYTMCHKSCTKMCLIWPCKVQKQYKLRYYAKSKSMLDIKKSGSSTTLKRDKLIQNPTFLLFQLFDVPANLFLLIYERRVFFLQNQVITPQGSILIG